MRYFLMRMTAMAVAMMGLAFNASQAFGQSGVGCFLAHPNEAQLRSECINRRDDKTFNLVERTVTGELDASDRTFVICNGNYVSDNYPNGHAAPTWTVRRAKFILINKSSFVSNDGMDLTMADSSTVHLADEVMGEAEQCINCGINCPTN